MNLENKIIQISEVFEPELLKAVKDEIDNSPFKYGWKSSRQLGHGFSHWNHSYVKSPAYNSIDISEKIPETLKTAWNFIKQKYTGEEGKLLRCYINGHTYGVEGYPHTDSLRHTDHTMVIYMTPDWKRFWGGETMIYQQNKVIHAELPMYNNGLIFPSHEVHSARQTTRACPALRITLMFKFSNKQDDKRDFLQQFLIDNKVNELNHKNRSLIKHLLAVYDRLKAHGYQEDVCLAGGLHSIFGTNIYKKQALTEDKHGVLIEKFGKDVIHLVDLFRSIKRPWALENALIEKHSSNIDINHRVELNSGNAEFIGLTNYELNSLCAIEAINLDDQNGLSKYEYLSRLITVPIDRLDVE